MANPSIVVLPQPSALAPADRGMVLALGREVVARVAAVSGDGSLFLKVGTSLIAARTDEPLQAGDVLRLQVSEAGNDRVVLKLLPPAQVPPPARAAEPQAPVRFELPLAELQPLADELERQAARSSVPTPVAVRGLVVTDGQGRLQLRLPSGDRLQLPDQVSRALTPGQLVQAALEPALPEAPTATVGFRPLPPPADQRAALVRQLTAQLAPQLGAKTAAGIAEFVAARGVSAGDAPLLAARLLAQQSSPVELLRELAETRPKAHALLQSIERDLVSGDPDRVRSALSRLGLDQEKQLAAGKLTEPTTLKSMSGPDGESAVSAQQLLLLKPESDPIAPVFLFLPLPDEGQARLVVQDDSEQDRADGHFTLRGELDMARTGTVSFQLHAVEQGAFLLIKSPDGAVVDHLRAGVQPLVSALERVLGARVSLKIAQSAQEAASPIAVNFEKTDLYA